MTWAAVGGAVATWGLNQLTSTDPQQQAAAAAAAADPFASQRPRYQSELAGLMAGTVDPTKLDPSYQFRLSQGSGNLERQLAARGGIGSGAEKTALLNYGQDLASTEFSNEFSRLAQLAGVNAGSPGQAGQILGNQAQIQQQGLGQLGNAIGTGVINWWNTPSTTDSAQTTTVPSGGMTSTGVTPAGNYWDYNQTTPSWALTPTNA